MFPITKKVELIGKNKFATIASNPEHEAFIIHIVALSINSGYKVYSSKKTQIAYLKADEAFIEILSKYADFADILSVKLATELFKHTGINDLIIKLIDD